MFQSEVYRDSQPSFWSLRNIILFILFTAGIWQFGNGVYIHAKASIAQLLISKAWSNQLHSDEPVSPWPWADTWPIAKLNFPGQNQQLYVLAGSTDAIIAFGPGHLVQSAYPGQSGNSVIMGHNDTHFALLENVNKGDLIEITTKQASTLYQIEALRIAHQDQVDLLEPELDNTLTLITCYPFDTLSAGTDLRYVVTARKINT